MNFDKITRKSIELLGKTIVHLMPKKTLANEEIAKKHMKTGDKNFEFTRGDFFTCGFFAHDNSSLSFLFSSSKLENLVMYIGLSLDSM